MRLLNAKTYIVHEFPNEDENRPYAILSHTWGDEECTLQHMADPSVVSRKGYAKIKYCCEQAEKDGLEWAWVDTCCIDKSSTAELSEAINSMFRWYRDATICYTYLADVQDYQNLGASRWFRRGWTLQELIAPKDIRFYTSNWRCLGSKLELHDRLSEITGIEKDVLSTGVFEHICIAKRMSWAAYRRTTRVEDLAYSLMGIFEVNMPLLYGEGRKSFVRLQEEIMKVSDDHTLFAWGLPAKPRNMYKFASTALPENLHGLLADSPADFELVEIQPSIFTQSGAPPITFKHEIRPLDLLQSDMPPIIFSNGVRIELPIFELNGFTFAALSCTIRHSYKLYLGIPLISWSQRYMARCGDLVLINYDFSSPLENYTKKTLLIKKPISTAAWPLVGTFRIQTGISEDDEYTDTSASCINKYILLNDVHCLSGVGYSPESHRICLPPYRDGPHAALFFTNKYDGCISTRNFAIVVGSDMACPDGPWVAVLPILDEKYEDKDAHALPHEDSCAWSHEDNLFMTERQLVSLLNGRTQKLSFLADRKQHVGKDVRRTLGYKTESWSGPDRAHDTLRREISGRFDIDLNVELRMTPLNQAEQEMIIRIDIFVSDCRRSKRKANTSVLEMVKKRFLI